MSIWDNFSPETVTYYPFEDKRIYWKMRSPSFLDERDMSAFWAEGGHVSTDITARELAITFVETTFPSPDSPTQDPGEKAYVPGLKTGDSIEKIENFLNTLPAVVVQDMWNLLKEVAPHWGPDFPRQFRPRRPASTGKEA